MTDVDERIEQLQAQYDAAPADWTDEQDEEMDRLLRRRDQRGA